MSLDNAAQTPKPIHRNNFICPRPARAPTVINKGTLGIGSPIVSAKTQINSTVYPCCIRNGIKLCTYSFPLAFKSSAKGRVFVKLTLAFSATEKIKPIPIRSAGPRPRDPGSKSPEAFLFRPGCLRLLPYDRPCGQSGDYPERQIYQQKVDCEHRPALPKPEIPRAPHRQEDCVQRQHRREEV